MRPVLFKIGKLSIPGYGFMIAIGFVAAIIVGEYRAKKKGLDSEAIIDLAIIAILTGFLGAKILYILISFREFLESPGDFLKTSGFVVYGGIISGVLCCMLYCRIKKLKFLDYFDIVMPEVAIAQGFGRIGCFLAGCCYGAQTDLPIGVVFPQGSLAPAGIHVHPTQIYSSVFDFILGFLLLYYGKKKRVNGKVVGMYLMIYSIGRFCVEFLRNDPRGSVGVLSTSQFIAIFTLVLGIIIFNINKFFKGEKKSIEDK